MYECQNNLGFYTDVETKYMYAIISYFLHSILYIFNIFCFYSIVFAFAEANSQLISMAFRKCNRNVVVVTGANRGMLKVDNS